MPQSGADAMDDSHPSRKDAFLLGILHAVAGGSFVAGLHELDQLLVLAAPAAVLWFLTLMAAALGAAVLAAAGMRRLARASIVLLLVGYAVLLGSSWYRFVTDPGMLEQQDYDQPAHTSLSWRSSALPYA
jgi:hypothetical protein